MKNKFLKYINYCIVVAMIISIATSCKKFLDVDPQGQTKSEDFWITEQDAAKAVNSIYANLRSWNNVAFAAIAIESLGSDEAEKGSAPNDADYLNDYDQFTVKSTQGQIQGFWEDQYKNINLCNQVLDNLPTMTSVSSSLKERYLAEAKFVRAYSYFRLVRAFGDVPLRLHVPVGASEYNIPRTPKTQVWDAIESDLNDAAAVLPSAYTGADVGRATKGAALSLHAKVSMYRGNWQDVKTFTDQVISSNVYSLFANYEQLFRVANENCSESIFEIQAALILNNSGSSNSQYSQVQGVRGTVAGWGFNVATTDLVNAYEPNDPRKDATIIFRGETTPEGDAIPATGDADRFNQKSYVPFSQIVSGYSEGCQQNIRVIRYADVLLMNAEANNELGNAAAALNSLNMVRARARNGAPIGTLPDITMTDKTALRNAIWQERKVELAMESDRYFDVIRQGRAATVFGPKGWKANKNEVWPIPQNEIDKSFGTLTQNAGY